jgi:hypothetical protein
LATVNWLYYRTLHDSAGDGISDDEFRGVRREFSDRIAGILTANEMIRGRLARRLEGLEARVACTARAPLVCTIR